MKKKVIAMMVACTAIVMMAGTATAFAHSGETKHSGKTTVCRAQNCAKTGTHKHGGKTYLAHHSSDGHSYHKTCSVSGCSKTGTHKHNGKAYKG